MRKLIFGLLVVLLLAGCSECRQAMDMRVVVKAGDVEFTMYDLDCYMIRMNYTGPDDELYKKEDFLKQHLDKLLIADAGIKFGLLDSVEVDTEQVSRILYEIVYKNEITDKLNVNDAAVRKFWEKFGGVVHIAQLQVEDKNLADSLSAVLKSSPEKFDELVAAFSTDEISKPKGGDIGWKRVTDIPYELQEPIFSLKQGEISDPIDSPFGYEIIKYIERQKYTEDDYKNESQIYRQHYSILRRNILQRELAEKLGRKFNFKINDDVLQMLIDKALKFRQDIYNLARPLSQCISSDELTEAERNAVIATFDGYEYKAGEFLSELRRQYRQDGINFDKVRLAKQALTMLILPRMMRQYGFVSGIEDTPQFKRQYQDTKIAFVYQKYLIEHILDTVTVTPDEMIKRYRDTMNNYAEPEQIKCAEIQAETQEAAQEILNQLHKGVPFEELVKMTTRRGFASTNGNLGYCSEKQYRPIYMAAKGNKKGSYVGPIAFDNKWSVIRVGDVIPARIKPFEEMESTIRTMVDGSKKYDVQNKWLEEQKKKVENNINMDLVKENLESGTLKNEK